MDKNIGEDIKNFMYKLLVGFASEQYNCKEYVKNNNNSFLKTFKKNGLQKTIEKYTNTFLFEFRHMIIHNKIENKEDFEEFKLELFNVFITESNFTMINNLQPESINLIQLEFFSILGVCYDDIQKTCIMSSIINSTVYNKNIINEDIKFN